MRLSGIFARSSIFRRFPFRFLPLSDAPLPNSNCFNTLVYPVLFGFLRRSNIRRHIGDVRESQPVSTFDEDSWENDSIEEHRPMKQVNE